ncbi:PREDICTED: F-box protein At3g54460-like isoform X2 [Camelina sativa]|uniref:F-box protein At3g54460-like isoform X1 n=1 Tax=Camelina sativa TaxID=90675 RepID=A0ABM0TJ35_CAMSA|nr:PREDICTED: F-box protein At3g54460-like isoform X1 [Camelina sativa]XP_010427145.1 PREDICTED: F-box protein At3g54460-like isoform X2 [Camelina sativa]
MAVSVEIDNHKLCGFLCIVLSVDSPDLLQLGSSCSIFNDGSVTGFKSDNGIILSLINPTTSNLKSLISSQGDHDDAEDCGTIGLETPQKRRKCVEVGSSSNSSGSTRKSLKSKRRVSSGSKEKTGGGRKRGRSIGLVNGSISVVQQLHALVAYKCLKIYSRVVKVDKGENGEERAVVLVDVYLPIALWSGWQFPKSQATAAAVFKHISCDWGLRVSILNGERVWEKANGRIKAIWDLSDCHVFDCKLLCYAPDSPKRRLFRLHEIFKSLPSPRYNYVSDSSRVLPSTDSCASGIWDLSDDVLISILMKLDVKELVSIAAVCRLLRSLTSLIVPCMNLKLFPHQQAAVGWMLERERKAEVFSHPLYLNFDTEDGFSFYVNSVTGDIITEAAPMVKDFRGGMFCDEPGLGKTITTLSLILKTQGTMADPPEGLPIVWCTHRGDKNCAYYEFTSDQFTSNGMLTVKRFLSPSSCRNQFSFEALRPQLESKSLPLKQARLMDQTFESKNPNFENEFETHIPASLDLKAQCRKSLGDVRKNLLHAYNGASELSEVMETKRIGSWKKCGMITGCKRKGPTDSDVERDIWIQCDSCSKWRRIIDEGVSVTGSAWFCSNNGDPAYQSCNNPEELWDRSQPIKYLQGFVTKGASGEEKDNISFFTSVLREHKSAVNSTVKKALLWLAKLPLEKLSQMETVGLSGPVLGLNKDALGFQRIFRAFGLKSRVDKGVIKWFYPKFLENLVFDVPALKVALCQPLDTVRLYLSKATLIVVPSNLVNHWITQIEKHVSPDQLRILLWTDHIQISPHSLAWDYDVVITTFRRLSAEWNPRKKSPMIQVHWLRVILDEGHTLGSSVSLTNKFQMAVSLIACNRWLLTGTPTPNTPNSQLSHLQPLLKFLHEEVYGENLKFWEAGILRPFEAEIEEGRLRLLQLLQRCMISSRKKDLQMIPPCIKKLTYLNFVPGHARSYNELVETVRRNILLADWNDPSHVESLLNSKQWKFRSNTIRNVRLSCCVAGHIKMTDAGHDIKETMDALLGSGLELSTEEFSIIENSLISGCNCKRCGEWCRLPVITPCRHLLCLDCVALDSERCTIPGCGHLYEMQTPETLARPENPNPKWPVPKDLIELQPSYNQDTWNPDWQSTSSSKVSYLVDRLRKLQESNRKSILSFNKTDSDNNLEDNPPGTSEAFSRKENHGQDCGSQMVFVDKVLIFSQFLEHIHVIEQQLTTAGIKFGKMYSPMPSCNKMKSLAMFQNDADCMALLMDGSAALGLDLSFVTHVFLMEPIWDKSMEEQVISRAHRMGAKRPIYVETLTMRGTIEEQMMRFLEDAEKNDRLLSGDYVKAEQETTRSRRTLHDLAESNYLSHLNFVRSDGKMEFAASQL